GPGDPLPGAPGGLGGHAARARGRRGSPLLAMHQSDRMGSSLRSGPVRSRVLLLAGTSVYIIVCVCGYLTRVAPPWQRSSYGFLPPDSFRAAVPYLGACLVPILWMPTRIERPTQLAYWAFYLVLFVPSVLMPRFAMNADIPSFSELVGFLTLAFLILG